MTDEGEEQVDEKPEEATLDEEEINPLKILEEKLEKLSTQLESENEPAKQQELIKSIDLLVNVIAKLKSN